MESNLKKYIKGDSIIWVVFLALCLISIVEMFSASSELAFKHTSFVAPMLRHVVFLVAGTVIVFFVQFVPLRYIRMTSYILLAASIVLLILVLIMGIRTNEAARWLVIGGIQFQPSELAKLSLIIVAADFIARIKDSKLNEDTYFRLLMGVSVVVCGLILKENFSTAALLFGVIFLMMFIGKISWKKLTAIVLITLALMISGYIGGKIYIKNKATETEQVIAAVDTKKEGQKSFWGKFLPRLETWVVRIDRYVEKKDDSTKYSINDENYQAQLAKIAIAEGGFFGKMPGNSVQRDYIPQAYSDFIFAIIVEEAGMVGAIFVILLYLTILFRAGRIATKSSTVFPAILMIGLSLMIVLQAFVNMAVATGLGPVTGQPLPMISRGGTSILITSIYFGVLLSITRHIKDGDADTAMYEEVVTLDDEDYEVE